MPLSNDTDHASNQSEGETNIGAGDLVRIGSNLSPHYKVIAVSGEKAWVRNLTSGTDDLVLLSRCRKISDQEPT